MPTLNKYGKILKRARIRIEFFDAWFVCWAVGEATKNENLADKITDHIRWLLCGESTVTDWLKKQGFPSGKLSNKEQDQYRIRWIDHMLANDPFFHK
jgi:hypothetical protein